MIPSDSVVSRARMCLLMSVILGLTSADNPDGDTDQAGDPHLANLVTTQYLHKHHYCQLPRPSFASNSSVLPDHRDHERANAGNMVHL